MESQRRSHKMSGKNWATIDAIAKDLNATATTGRRIGLPSWRSLLYQVATGKLTVESTVVVKERVTQTTLYVMLMDRLITDTIKAVNRLEVKPRSASAKRHILARLRAANADGAHGQHNL